MYPNLNDRFPILEADNDLIVSKMGDITIVYALTKPEIFTLSQEDFQALHETWVKAIKVLPTNSTLHMQDWFIRSHYQADFEKSGDHLLSEANERHQHETPWLDHHCILFLTKRPQGHPPATSAASALLRKSMVPEDSLSPEAIQEFTSHCHKFERILQDSSFLQCRRFPTNELASSSDQAGIIEQYCQLTPPDQPPQLLDIDFHNSDYTFFRGTMEAKILVSYSSVFITGRTKDGTSVGLCCSLNNMIRFEDIEKHRPNYSQSFSDFDYFVQNSDSLGFARSLDKLW